MNGLVSGYGSDSDDEGSKHESKNDWMECMDNTTGYPYFWNRVTNEVKWDRPSEMPPSAASAHSNSSATNGKRSEPAKPSKGKKRERGKSPPQVFIGPTLPQLTPEEIARQKVSKFEEAMCKEMEKEILREDPPDWLGSSKPVKNLYSKPFAWKKTSTCLQIYKDMSATLKKASHSINLIAGSYGDDDDTEEEEEEKGSNKKRSVNVKVQKPASKQSKVSSKNVFKNNEADEEKDAPKKKRRWDVKDRTYISSTAETLCMKLESLDVAKVPITPLKLLAIRVETLFTAWQSGALSSSYLQTSLDKMSTQMLDIESHDLAPPGWRAVWDRSAKKYAYENLITRETQFEKPDEGDDDEEEDAVKSDDKVGLPIKETSDSNPALPQPPLPPPIEEAQNPPLPPEVQTAPPPPPPPPIITKPENQVEDMELSDEEVESISIIETPKEERTDQDHITDALSSFYSDLATIDGSASQGATPTPPKVASPAPSFIREGSPALSDDRSQSPSSIGDTLEERRKRKATKLSSGLSMKKKNVGSLVAKWQNIQDEVKRNQE